MPPVITEAATVICAHAGKITPSSSQHKLTVGGVAVLLAGDLTGKDFATCPNASVSSSPCKNTLSESGIFATKLKVNGTAVLLAGSNGTTNGMPLVTALWAATDPGQTKLQAI